MSEPARNFPRIRWRRVLVFLIVVVALLCWPRIWALSVALNIPDVAPMPLPEALDSEAGRGFVVLCAIVLCGVLIARQVIRHESDSE